MDRFLGFMPGKGGFEGSGSEWGAGGAPEPRPGPPAGGRIHPPPPENALAIAGAFFFDPLLTHTGIRSGNDPLDHGGQNGRRLRFLPGPPADSAQL